MVVCTVCQGEQFDLQDGHYYCRDCHTQALDWREEDREDGYTQNTRISYLATTFKTTEDQDAEKSQSAIADLWTSWEGLNSILLGQVSEIESLTSMPQEFRFVVFNLWAKYLQVTDIAFSKNRLMPHHKKALSTRDLAWINQQRLINRKKRRRRISKRSVISMTEDSSEVSSKRSISSLKRKLINRQYLSDSSTQDSSASSMTDTDADMSSDPDEDPDLAKWKKMCDKQIKKFKPRRLTRITLLGLLFLALRLSKSEVQLSDLYRWLRWNHVTHRWVEHLLPGESALKAGDRDLLGPKYSVFQHHSANKEFVITEAIEIYKLLDGPIFPIVDVLPLVRRFLKELLLPESLEQYIAKIVKFSPPNLQFKFNVTKVKYIPLAENRAMGFIVFILKLMLGLDDLTEYQCSNLAESKKDSNKLFAWTKWVDLVELRNSILVDNFFWAKNLYDPNAIQTKNNAFKPHHNATNSIMEIHDADSGYMYHTTKLYLSSLGSRLMNKPSVEEPEPKPDPTKSLHFLSDALPIALAEGNFKHMAEDVTERVERSRSASCAFLLEKKKKFFKTSAEEVPEIDSNERTKLFYNVEGISVRHKMWGETVRVKVLKQPLEKEMEPQEPTEQRQQLPASQAFHSYWVLPMIHTVNETMGEKIISKNLPLSLLWLLRQCAAVVDTSAYSLYRELLVIETTLLLDGNEDGCTKDSLSVIKSLKALY